MAVPGPEKGRAAHHQGGGVGAQHAPFGLGLGQAIGVEWRGRCAFKIRPARQAVEHQVAGEGDEPHRAGRTGLGQCGRADDVVSPLARVAFGLVDSDIASGIDPGPGLPAADRGAHRIGLGDVALLAREQMERQAALVAQAREGSAQRAQGTGDQHRSAVHGVPSRLAVHRVQVANRPHPPAVAFKHRVIGGPVLGQLARGGSQRRGPRRVAAGIPHPRLVGAVALAQQAVPVHGAEGRPHGHGPNVRAFCAQALRRAPGAGQPTQLLFAAAAQVHLGDRHRQPVALPGFADTRLHAAGQVAQHAHRFHVDIAMAPVAAVPGDRVVLDPVVKKPVARHIVIDAHHIGRAGRIGQRVQLGFTDAVSKQVGPQRVSRDDAAAQQIKRQPAAGVLELGLVTQRRCRVGDAQVIGLHQLRRRVDPPDLAHGQASGQHLVEQSPQKAGVAAMVRVPDAVQRTETRGGQRLVDWRVGIQMRVTLRHRAGIAGQCLRKGRVEQLGITRPAAMVKQSRDAKQAQRLHAVDAGVCPAKIKTRSTAQRAALPQQGQANALDAQAGDAVQVIEALRKSGLFELVAVSVAHPVDGAFRPRPQLQRTDHSGGRAAMPALAAGVDLATVFSWRWRTTVKGAGDRTTAQSTGRHRTGAWRPNSSPRFRRPQPRRPGTASLAAPWRPALLLSNECSFVRPPGLRHDGAANGVPSLALRPLQGGVKDEFDALRAPPRPPPCGDRPPPRADPLSRWTRETFFATLAACM